MELSAKCLKFFKLYIEYFEYNVKIVYCVSWAEKRRFSTSGTFTPGVVGVKVHTLLDPLKKCASSIV